MPKCKYCIYYPFETVRDIMNVSEMVELIDRPGVYCQVKQVVFTRDYHHMHLKYKVLIGYKLRWKHHNEVKRKYPLTENDLRLRGFNVETNNFEYLEDKK